MTKIINTSVYFLILSSLLCGCSSQPTPQIIMPTLGEELMHIEEAKEAGVITKDQCEHAKRELMKK